MLEVLAIALITVMSISGVIALLLLFPRFIEYITLREREGSFEKLFWEEAGLRGINITSSFVIFFFFALMFNFSGAIEANILLGITVCFFGFIHFSFLSGFEYYPEKFWLVFFLAVVVSFLLQASSSLNLVSDFITMVLGFAVCISWGVYSVYHKARIVVKKAVDDLVSDE